MYNISFYILNIIFFIYCIKIEKHNPIKYGKVQPNRIKDNKA